MSILEAETGGFVLDESSGYLLLDKSAAFLGGSVGAAQTVGTSPLTIPWACPAGTSCLIAETIFSDSDGGVTMSATYDGETMLFDAASIGHTNGSTYGFTQVFYLMDPPTGVLADLVITASGGAAYNRILGAALCYANAGAPTGFAVLTGSGTLIPASTHDVTVPADGIGCQFAASELAIATTETHTERWALNNSNFSGAANGKHQESSTPGVAAFQLSCTSGPWTSVKYVIPVSG